MDHLWVHKSCQQTCFSESSSLHVTCQDPAPVWAFHGVTDSFRHSPALTWIPLGMSSISKWITSPLWTNIGCRGPACLSTVLSRSSRGISALALEAPPSHPSCLQGCSSHISSLPLQLQWPRVFPFPFLNVIPKALPALPWAAVCPSWSPLVLTS